MTNKQLIEWAQRQGPTDKLVWVGRETTLLDVKRAVCAMDKEFHRLADQAEHVLASVNDAIAKLGGSK